MRIRWTSLVVGISEGAAAGNPSDAGRSSPSTGCQVSPSKRDSDARRHLAASEASTSKSRTELWLGGGGGGVASGSTRPPPLPLPPGAPPTVELRHARRPPSRPG